MNLLLLFTHALVFAAGLGLGVLAVFVWCLTAGADPAPVEGGCLGPAPEETKINHAPQ